MLASPVFTPRTSTVISLFSPLKTRRNFLSSGHWALLARTWTPVRIVRRVIDEMKMMGERVRESCVFDGEVVTGCFEDVGRVSDMEIAMNSDVRHEWSFE